MALMPWSTGAAPADELGGAVHALPQGLDFEGVVAHDQGGEAGIGAASRFALDSGADQGRGAGALGETAQPGIRMNLDNATLEAAVGGGPVGGAGR